VFTPKSVDTVLVTTRVRTTSEEEATAPYFTPETTVPVIAAASTVAKSLESELEPIVAVPVTVPRLQSTVPVEAVVSAEPLESV